MTDSVVSDTYRPADVPIVVNGEWRSHPAIRLVVFFAIFLSFSVFGVMLEPIVGVDGGEIAVEAFTVVGAVIGYWAMTWWLERRRPPTELDPKRTLGLLGGIGVGAALISLCVGSVWLVGGLSFHGVRPFEEVAWVWWVVRAGIVAGVVEEILLRGIMFRMIEHKFGSWIAVGFSALLFGLAHIFNDGATLFSSLAIALEAGLLFAAVYMLTRSLWWVIGLHAAWNVVQGAVFGIAVSGNEAEGLLISEPVGSAVISGGVFGVEASVVTVVLLTSLAVFGLVTAHKQGKIVRPFWVKTGAEGNKETVPNTVNAVTSSDAGYPDEDQNSDDRL